MDPNADLPSPAEEIVVEMHGAWAKRDMAGTLACCADDIVFALRVSEEILSFGGEARGKIEVGRRLQTLLDGFETVYYAPGKLKVEGDTVRAQIRYRFKHKKSGQDIDGVMRQLIAVENGLIARVDEFHDAERIRAFLKLAES